MAYKLDLGVKTVHGTNPQNLIEHIVRDRIFASTYWKEQCFGLNAADLAKRAMDLTYVGGTYGGNRKPTPFLCLALKMLMIQPEMEIVEAFIHEKDFRYVRLLGVFYLRLVGNSRQIYKELERIYADNRKFKYRQLDGSFTIEYIDDFVDRLLRENRVCDTTLPPLALRHTLQEKGLLGKRESLLDAELAQYDDDEDEEYDEMEDDIHTSRRDETSPDTRRAERSPDTRRSERSPDTRRAERSPDTRRRAERSPDTRRAERSPDVRRRAERSPDTRRAERSPDTRRAERSPDVRRAERSPDTRRAERSPDTRRRAERSPDVRRRAERSPDTRRRSERSPDTRRAERSPDTRRRAERSPDTRRRAERSPDVRRRGDRSPDTRRDGRSSYSAYDDEYSKKRSRSIMDDGYSKYEDYPSKQYKSRESSHPSSKPSTGGGGKGGLREMNVDQMNELRLSIGLKPLK